jgi:hypothetical protein
MVEIRLSTQRLRRIAVPLITPAFAGPPMPDGRKPGRIRVVPLIADRFKAAGLTIGVV